MRKDHPLRAMRTVMDGVLQALSVRFDRMYARQGQPSIASSGGTMMKDYGT